MYTNYTKKYGTHGGHLHKFLLVMKITTFIIFAVMLQVSAAGFAQKVTISGRNARLTEVFNQIRTQTGYDFLFTAETLKDSKRVSIAMKDAELRDVLNKIFEDQPLEYIINKKSVIVSKKEPSFLDKVVDALTPPIDVDGVVLDEKGLPLVGATVKVKGYKQSTTTDAQGRFRLANVDDKAVLVISFIGYAPKEVAVKANLSVALEIQSAELQEVNVAYGKTTQQALTGSVTVVKGEQIQNLPNRSFDKSLQGQVPGLHITSGNGQPGSGTSNFLIRGIGTGTPAGYGSADRQPLIVVDGVPLSGALTTVQEAFSQNPAPIVNPLASINPSDIETITVLKDASALALYGSRASNGVILITTKTGKQGKSTLQFLHQTDLATPIYNKDQHLNQDQYLTLVKESYKNADPVTWTDEAILTDLKNLFPTYLDANGNARFYIQSDWLGQLFKSPALTFNNELSASGGNDKAQHYLNLSLLTQKGTISNTGFDRLTAKYNFSNKPVAWLKMGMNTSFGYTNNNYLQSSGSEDPGNGLAFAVTMSPLNPIKLKNGKYNLQPFFLPGVYTNNPLAELEYNTNKTESYRFIGNLFAEFQVLKNLSFKSTVGSDILFGQLKRITDPRLSASFYEPAGPGLLMDGSNQSLQIVNTNLLNYSLLNGPSTISFLLGQETQVEKTKYLNASKNNINISNLTDLNAAITVVSVSGNVAKTTLASYFAQANYSYLDDYYLSLGVRRDGSSKFGINNRFGNYWSVGAGWIFSNNPVFKEFSFLDYGKLRGSLGTSGNSSPLSVLTQFNTLRSGSINGNPAVLSTPGNPNIAWENTFNKDIGLELRFSNGISTTIDVYQRSISNLIYNYRTPGTSGIPGQSQNVGKMLNKGLEISVSADVIKNDNFGWNINANWSANKNKLTKADVPLTVSGNLIDQEGANFDSFYLVRWAGVDPADGMPQYYNLQGQITKTYSPDDKVIVGKPQPDGFGAITSAFNYKSWRFSAFFYYEYGYEVYDAALNYTLNDGQDLSYANQSVRALNRWQKPGDIAENPRRVLGNTDGGATYATSDRFLFDGDYIRLKNISLSYSLTKEFCKKIGLSNVKASIQANNVALWTKYKGSNPENIGNVGETGFSYPQSKSYALVLDILF